MGNFLKENWLWIATPIVVVMGLLIYLFYYSESGADSPFIYNIW